MNWLEERFPEVAAAVGTYKLRGETQAKGQCPNRARHKHGDKHPSFLMSLGNNGGLCFICRAGCPKIEILRSIPGNNPAKPWRIVCHDRPKPLGDTMKVLVKTYQYLNPESVEWCQVCRFVGPHGKDFRPRRLVPGQTGQEWVWNLSHAWVKRVQDPYGVKGFGWIPAGPPDSKPQPDWVLVPEAVPYFYNANIVQLLPENIVFHVEGEKDCDTLAGLGLVAITTQGGSGGRLFPKQYAEQIKGRHVVFLPDNDQSGDDYARWYIGCAVSARAASVTRIDLPGLAEKGDASDWVFANRKDAADVGIHSTPARMLKDLVGRSMGYSRKRVREMFTPKVPGRTSREPVPVK